MRNKLSGPGLTTFDEFAKLLRQQLDDLTPNQQRLARQFLSDPEGCAFMTITELAKVHLVSPVRDQAQPSWPHATTQPMNPTSP